MKERPSPAILRQLLRYEPETGKLFWLIRDRSFFATDKDHKWWNGRFAGKQAFTARCGSMNHRHGKIFGQSHRAHIVAWAIHYGEWPSDDVDHIHGVDAGDWIENLRVAGHSANMKNKALYKKNTSGVHGVYQRNGKWIASIRVDGKRTQIGSFDDFESAKAARLAVQKSEGFHANHGRTVQ